MKSLFLSLALIIVSSSLYGYTDIEKVRQLRKCVDCKLRGAIFSHYDLTGVDLRRSNLQFAQFRGSTLYKANLEGANIRGANFSGARWIDGTTTCAEGSIGKCNVSAEEQK